MKRFLFIIFCYILCGWFCLFAEADSRITFNQGIEAFKAGNYSSAELLFRKTLENDDEYRDRAWFYLSRTVFQQQKYRAAIFEFNSFLTKCRTENLRVEARFWIGESYFNLNESLKAIEEYNRFLEKSDDMLLVVTAHDRMATIYYKQSRYEEAIIEWEKAISKSQDQQVNAKYILKIGNALFENRQYEQALERLNPLLTARLDSNEKAETRMLVGRIYQIQGDHKKAIVMFNAIPRELAGIYPFHDVYYFRAMSYLAEDKESLARSDLELFYMIGKKSDFYPDGTYEFGRLLVRSSKPETGVEMLVKIWENLEKPELSAKSGLILADYYLEKEPGQSVRYLERFIDTEDDTIRKSVLVTLSKACIKSGRYERAEQVLDTFMDKYPYDEKVDEVLFLQALISLEKGDIDKASELFDRIRNEHPFSKFLNDSEYYIALVNYKKENYSQAITSLKEYLLKKDINNAAEAHLLLNELYLKTDDIKNAEREVQYLASKYPELSGMDRVIFRLAIKISEKNPDAADRYFKMLQSMYPDSAYSIQVNYIYGNRFFEKKNYPRAITYYEKFLNGGVEENRGTAFFNIIYSYYELKQYEKVIEILKNAKIPPMDEIQWKEIPLINARSFYMLGRHEEVYSLLKWEDIRTLGDNDSLMLIESTIKTGDINTAEKLIDQVQDKAAIYSDSMMMLADYYRDSKESAKAQEIYNRILMTSDNEELKERAILELAVINTENGAYAVSLELLQKITLKKLTADRDALIIVNNFNSGNEKAGADLTEAKLKYIPESRFEEKIYLMNLLYNYEQNNEKNFLKYSRLLKKYKEDQSYVNYLSARLYYEKGNYNRAYSFYVELTSTDSIYTSEAGYFTGRITLVQRKNRAAALKIFTDITSEGKDQNEYFYKSKVELAIIQHELNNDEASVAILREIIDENYNIKYRTQAENLLENYTALAAEEPLQQP